MNRSFPASVVLLCLGGTVTVGGQPAELPASHAVRPALYATGFEFAEGPALDAAGNLFVVNYRGNGNIGLITPDGTASVFCDLRKLAPVEGRQSQANGLKVDGEGRLIAADAGGGRLLRIAADGKSVEVLADRCEGKRFNAPNDVALDLAGNIYFSDPGSSSADDPSGSIYLYNIKTSKVARLDTELAYPNGLAVTPDQRYLCVSEDGLDGDQRVLIEFPREPDGEIRGGEFQPDGMIFDRDGRLYVAMWSGGVVNVVEVPSGRLLRQYDAGGGKATNCHFHDGWLYVTVVAKEAVFRLNLGVDGFDYNASAD